MSKYKKAAWGEGDVLCPFFLSQERKPPSIVCEGGIEGTKTRTYFDGMRARDAHMGRYCCAMYGFPKCPQYRFANQKYEKKETTKTKCER